MRGVYASSLSTFMVKFKSGRDFANKGLVRNSVGLKALSLPENYAIAAVDIAPPKPASRFGVGDTILKNSILSVVHSASRITRFRWHFHVEPDHAKKWGSS